jgi:hypothetical protein
VGLGGLEPPTKRLSAARAKPFVMLIFRVLQFSRFFAGLKLSCGAIEEAVPDDIAEKDPAR